MKAESTGDLDRISARKLIPPKSELVTSFFTLKKTKMCPKLWF